MRVLVFGAFRHAGRPLGPLSGLTVAVASTAQPPRAGEVPDGRSEAAMGDLRPPSHLHDTAVQCASAGDAAIHVMPLDIRRKRDYSHNRLDGLDYKVGR
jgi:hypothetical protein